MVADVVNTAGALAVTRFYVTPFLDQNLFMTDFAADGAKMYCYSQDGLGSVRTLTDKAGEVVSRYDYTAFGESWAMTTSEVVPQHYKWAGREQNVLSGTYSHRYRTCEPQLGRFLQGDPMGYVGDGWIPPHVDDGIFAYTAYKQQRVVMAVNLLNEYGFQETANIVLQAQTIVGHLWMPDPITESGTTGNLYTYSRNNPSYYTDPYGFSLWGKIWRIYKYFKKAGKTVCEIQQVSGKGKKNTVEAVKKALGDAKPGMRRVIVAEDDKARDAMARALSDDKKMRGPEKSAGYPKHSHPNAGDKADVHIQTETPGKGGRSATAADAARVVGAVLAPNAMKAAENPNGTKGQVIAAGAWDICCTIDPIFLTDAINYAFGIDDE